MQIEGHDSMATQLERIASLEAGRKGQWIALVAVATVGAGWMGWISIMLFGMKGDIQAVKQKLKDGGTGDIVSELKAPRSQDQLRASLSTVIAQVQTERVNGKAPDQKKSVALAEALTQVAKRNPEIPDSWRAVALLASFRTSYVLENPASMPDCNVEQKLRLIDPKEVPEVPEAKAFNGYIFRNCVLHLNHLPPLLRTYLTKPSGNYPAGSSLTAIAEAFIINCKIVLNDSGIADSNIFFFSAVNCRFE
jgi:hypothetical protein